MTENYKILCLTLILIFSGTSCQSNLENTTITEKSGDSNGLRTIGYPKKFKNEKSYSIYLQALDCVRRDDYNGCIKHLQRAVELDPKNPIIYNDLGLAETRLENFDQGVIYLEKAIHLDSNFYSAYTNLGLNFYYDKKYEKGIQILKKVPIDSTGRSIRGSLFYHLFMNYTKLEECDSAYRYYGLIKEFAENDLFLENLEGYKKTDFDEICFDY